MKYIEIKLPKCTVFITPDELNSLLSTNTELFAECLRRGKYITRARTLKAREMRKYEG